MSDEMDRLTPQTAEVWAQLAQLGRDTEDGSMRATELVVRLGEVASSAVSALRAIEVQLAVDAGRITRDRWQALLEQEAINVEVTNMPDSPEGL